MGSVRRSCSHALSSSKLSWTYAAHNCGAVERQDRIDDALSVECTRSNLWGAKLSIELPLFVGEEKSLRQGMPLGWLEQAIRSSLSWLLAGC